MRSFWIIFNGMIRGGWRILPHLLQQNSGNQLALLLMEVGPEGGKKPLGNFGTAFLGVKKRHYSNITVDKWRFLHSSTVMMKNEET